MIYTRSALEEINLSGNILKEEGICKVFRGVSIAKSLKKLLVADNQFSDTEDVLKSLNYCMKRNEKLGKYDLKYNVFADPGIEQLTAFLAECSHVSDIEIPERVENKEIMEAFRKQLAENKPKKGKGKKGGKKKKKK